MLNRSKQRRRSKEIAKPEGTEIKVTGEQLNTLIGIFCWMVEQKRCSNVITAPERVIDLFNGEMAED